MNLLVTHYYAGAQPITRTQYYAAGMNRTKKTIGYLATNTRFLMQRKGWNQEQLAKKAGVAQKTVSNVLNGIYDTKVETAEAIGRAFGLTGWHMISPYLIRDMEGGGSITKLVDNYMLASDEGQQLVMQIAEREAKYAVEKK